LSIATAIAVVNAQVSVRRDVIFGQKAEMQVRVVHQPSNAVCDQWHCAVDTVKQHTRARTSIGVCVCVHVHVQMNVRTIV
jgi:hypothetical protein